MPQDVRPLTRSVFKAPQNPHKFVMHSTEANIEYRLLANFLYLTLNFSFSFLVHLFDPCRLYTTISYQAIKGQTGHLSSNGVETREYNSLGGIVDYEVNTGQCFKGADIAAFPSDYPSLHLIVGKRYDRYGCLGNVIGRTSLNAVCHYLLGPFLRFCRYACVFF